MWRLTGTSNATRFPKRNKLQCQLKDLFQRHLWSFHFEIRVVKEYRKFRPSETKSQMQWQFLNRPGRHYQCDHRLQKPVER